MFSTISQFPFLRERDSLYYSSLNDGKGICNLSALVIRTNDMESRDEEEQAAEVHS